MTGAAPMLATCRPHWMSEHGRRDGGVGQVVRRAFGRTSSALSAAEPPGASTVGPGIDLCAGRKEREESGLKSLPCVGQRESAWLVRRGARRFPNICPPSCLWLQFPKPWSQAVEKPGGESCVTPCFPLAFLQFAISGSCLASRRIRTAVFLCRKVGIRMLFSSCIVAAQLLENLNQQTAANAWQKSLSKLILKKKRCM